MRRALLSHASRLCRLITSHAASDGT